MLAHLGSAATGLSAQEAAKRLAADGPNELKEGKRISPWQIFLSQFKSLIIWILIVAGVISGVLGEAMDAIAILAIVILNAVIGFYQEFNAEKSIAALKKLTAPQAKVRRDGKIEGVTGWAIGDHDANISPSEHTQPDAASLYDKLEHVVLPRFCQQRDQFVRIMRQAIALNAAHFNTQRMVQEYVVKAYLG